MVRWPPCIRKLAPDPPRPRDCLRRSFAPCGDATPPMAPVDNLRGTPLRLRDEHLRTTVELLRPVLGSTRPLLGVWDDAASPP